MGEFGTPKIIHSPLSIIHSPFISLRLAIFGGFEAALAHGFGEVVDQGAAVFPADAGVGDAEAVDQGFPWHEILTAGFEMAFDHDAENARIAGGDLAGDISADALGKLLDEALLFAKEVLRPGGDFLVKAFQGEGIDAFTRELKGHFKTVKTIKPKASRPESREIYLLARNFGM